MSGGVQHRFSKGSAVRFFRRKVRNNEVFSCVFPFLFILYRGMGLFAITELFRFEYSLEMKCLRNMSNRLHIVDNGYCKNFLCTFFHFLHNIM